VEIDFGGIDTAIPESNIFEYLLVKGKIVPMLN
jgi:hypothetical protein